MRQSQENINALLQKFESKEIRLPELQRKYVWKKKQIKQLLDSIYKDYPTGSILLWETDKEIVERDSAVTLQAKSEYTKKSLLLDGQQRLTSLLAVLKGNPIKVRKSRDKTPEEKIELYFNLDHPDSVIKFGGDISDDDDDDDDDLELVEDVEQEWFQLKTKKLLNKQNWVSVTEVCNNAEYEANLSEKFKENPNHLKYVRRLIKLKDLGKNYNFPVVTLGKELSYEEVTDVFIRVNSSGTKLNSSDLALAQITSRWENSLDTFQSFADQCSEKNYDISVNDLMRMLVAISTAQSKFKVISRTPIESIKSAWDDTKNAVHLTINFLKGNGQIESMGAIKSFYPLVPIGCIYHKMKHELSEKQSNLLLKWFFAAVIWSRYSGSVETTLDVDLSIIKNNDNYIEKMLDNIKQDRGGNLDVKESDLVGADARSPFFIMTYVLARQNHAKDWRTGTEFSLESSGIGFQNEIDHIFPKAVLQKHLMKKYDNNSSQVKKLVNDIGNLAFLSKVSNIKKGKTPPEEYFPPIIQRHGDEVLKAQYISTDSSLWALDRYEDFLKKRRQDIADAINNLMNSLG